MDDITPDMNWKKFWLTVELLESHDIKPLLGIVPDNRDANLSIEPPREDFWEIMRQLQSDGLADFAQHGYQHVYESRDAGIYTKYRYRPQSEFAGLPYDVQFQKIKKGKEILEREGINTDIWMAPSHTFDNNTLKALRALGFQSVTDGIALYPYIHQELLFVPQQTGVPRKFLCGVITVCLHTNSHSKLNLYTLSDFVDSTDRFIRYRDIVQQSVQSKMAPINWGYECCYTLLRNVKRSSLPRRRK